MLSVIFPHRLRAVSAFTPFLVKSRPHQCSLLWVHEHHPTDGIRNPAGVARNQSDLQTKANQEEILVWGSSEGGTGDIC